MNRESFADQLAKRGNMTQGSARELINLIFDPADGIFARELNKLDGEIVLSGFGKFSVVTRQAHAARNPLTGDAMNIPAKRVLRFKVGSNLKAKIASKAPRSADAETPAK